MKKKYDIMVVGAGHAGCEAACAAAKMGCEVLLITLNLDSIAILSGSSLFGGPGGAQLLWEIDALGGQTAIRADETSLYHRKSSNSDSYNDRAAVAVVNKREYHLKTKYFLENQKNIFLKQDMVTGLILEKDHVIGIRTKFSGDFFAGNVVIAGGTFLRGTTSMGPALFSAGRNGEISSNELSSELLKLGFKLGRHKVKSAPLIDSNTINKKKVDIQESDNGTSGFSVWSKPCQKKQLNCYITRAGYRAADLVLKNKNSPADALGLEKFLGDYPATEGAVRFDGKPDCTVVIQPVGQHAVEVFVCGLSMDMSEDAQLEIVREVEGLEKAEIMRPGYAVEYDFVVPAQLKPTLETKTIDGLFMAGQVIGTTGY
ncbi:FAD-dependent oxidoreductase, partial [Candidatus Oleimmundimicrobium sp.]|uniref:FAD-dependent oxidoreductase n=1 Tax=Candidatus Oleimmundimicrobium sp. TaxID=3060597 RepID=UPI002722315E